MKPKLYQYTACPFCNKVSALLQYKGVAYEAVEVHPLNKKEIAFSTDYRAVPIYVDSKGVQVNDSTPIMRHIDAEFPQNQVFRVEPEERAAEETWLAWSEKLVQSLPTVIYDSFPNAWKSFGYITKVGKFGVLDRFYVRLMGAFVMSLVAKKIQKRLGIENPEAFLRSMVSEWASQGLKGKEFCGGSLPNAADIAVYGICRTVASLDAGKIFQENADFMKWFNRLNERIQLTPAGS